METKGRTPYLKADGSCADESCADESCADESCADESCADESCAVLRHDCGVAADVDAAHACQLCEASLCADLFREELAGVPGARPVNTVTTPLLEVRGVSREFSVRRGGLQPPALVRAVENVSFALQRGETLGLVGESGCGKSTLARMIVRLLPVSSGDILFDGHSITHAAPRARESACGGDTAIVGTWASRLQMVFQDPFSSLNPRLSVGYSISEPLIAAGVPKAERKARVASMLERVGLLPEHAGRFPHAFSGGQRQRIAIARAIIAQPELVVCDEAVSALDASVQAQVLNLLKDVQEAFGLTYVFISHDLAVVGHMSERVAVMYLGRIVEIAPRKALFGGPLHPYTQALLASVPVRDPARATIPEGLCGELPSPLAPPAGCAFHTRCPLAQPVCREHLPQLVVQRAEHAVACHFA